jgi:hypothetical protein
LPNQGHINALPSPARINSLLKNAVPNASSLARDHLDRATDTPFHEGFENVVLGFVLVVQAFQKNVGALAMSRTVVAENPLSRNNLPADLRILSALTCDLGIRQNEYQKKSPGRKGLGLNFDYRAALECRCYQTTHALAPLRIILLELLHWNAD